MGNRCCCWHDAVSNLLFHTTQSMLGISSLNWKTIFLAVTGGRRGKITDGCLAHRKTRLFGRRWQCCCWWWQKKIRRAKLGGLARRIRGKKLWPDVGGTCNQQYYYPVARRRHVVQVGDCCCCCFSCCCLVVCCQLCCWVLMLLPADNSFQITITRAVDFFGGNATKDSSENVKIQIKRTGGGCCRVPHG